MHVLYTRTPTQKAGLALGAPAAFPHLKISDITTMNSTNINGYMYTTHAVLNRSFMPRKSGTILNITSVTGLEVPHFPGEAVYHANKACQEAFSNALCNELSGTNIKVLVLRPGIVATHFHSLRVGHDRGMYDEFMQGFEYDFPLLLPPMQCFPSCQQLRLNLSDIESIDLCWLLLSLNQLCIC
jgi:NADP-dependent 3-hydroxy acid dehydrogenase YdfG